MDWEQHFQQWQAACAASTRGGEVNALETKARNALQQHPVPDVEWLVSALKGTTEESFPRRNFIRVVLRRADQIPDILFGPLIHAAVYERDPSHNKLFIGPCLRWAGPRRVNEALLRYLENGTNAEKAGAASAFYWSMMPHRGTKVENITDLVARKNRLFLSEFVANEDVNVRRRILPGLHLNPEGYPEEMRPLIPQAIRLAREHPDEYIRHRIEIQLGHGGPYKALPT